MSTATTPTPPHQQVAKRKWIHIALLATAIGGLEFFFFRHPDLSGKPAQAQGKAASGSLARAGESRLKNIKQLTFGGENAEAYWSFDGKQIVFQSTRDGLKADQIFVMDANGKNMRRVSNGKGRTTCAYFLKGNQRVLFASTHLGGDAPPPTPDFSQGYVWPVYPTYDIFTANLDGSDLQQLTRSESYDAEATVSADGEKIVFTSSRDGDLELYTMDADGGNVKRLTHDVGYDGGAFFSPDGKQICYRAYHPKTEAEKKDYQDLLAKNLVRPSIMELFVMNADGSNKQQITSNGAANFCPFFTPDGKKLIFASNMDDPKGRNFDLYLIDLATRKLERITTDPTFDGFPMFSPDGKKLIFASNRNAKQRGETNVFVADFVW